MVLQAIMAYDQFGKDTEMIVQDSSSFAEDGERISFLQVQVRAIPPLIRQMSPPALLPLYCLAPSQLHRTVSMARV